MRNNLGIACCCILLPFFGACQQADEGEAFNEKPGVVDSSGASADQDSKANTREIDETQESVVELIEYEALIASLSYKKKKDKAQASFDQLRNAGEAVVPALVKGLSDDRPSHQNILPQGAYKADPEAPAHTVSELCAYLLRYKLYGDALSNKSQRMYWMPEDEIQSFFKAHANKSFLEQRYEAVGEALDRVKEAEKHKESFAESETFMEVYQDLWRQVRAQEEKRHAALFTEYQGRSDAEYVGLLGHETDEMLATVAYQHLAARNEQALPALVLGMKENRQSHFRLRAREMMMRLPDGRYTVYIPTVGDVCAGLILQSLYPIDEYSKLIAQYLLDDEDLLAFLENNQGQSFEQMQLAALKYSFDESGGANDSEISRVFRRAIERIQANSPVQDDE